ncbi:MAG: hypothetical protein ABI728_04060 [Betaproteobacteria bacterium]
MTKRIRLVQSPFNPPLQAVDDIVFNLHVPCSTKQVTIQVNPNVEQYSEDAEATNVQVRAVKVAAPTDQTKVVLLDFGQNKKRRIEIENKRYDIELVSIGKKKIQNENFPVFELDVSDA